jgi:hypothetical protein
VFLQYIADTPASGHGISDGRLVGLGYFACDFLSASRSYQDAVRELMELIELQDVDPPIDDRAAKAIVTTANQRLCPAAGMFGR